MRIVLHNILLHYISAIIIMKYNIHRHRNNIIIMLFHSGSIMHLCPNNNNIIIIIILTLKFLPSPL